MRLPALRFIASRLLWTAVCFCMLEGAVFRTGVYRELLLPNSSAGLLNSLLRYEKNRAPRGGSEVLAIGDSRMAFKPRAANQLTGETGLRFGTIAMPGSTPRCWYYMLRDADPGASRYAAILIGVNDYDDEDYEDLSGREMDIRYVVPLLHLSDVFTFPASYPDWQRRAKALSAALFKGYAYRADFQDLLSRPHDRIMLANAERNSPDPPFYFAKWSDDDLSGLQVDWKARTIVYPPRLTPAQRAELFGVILREPAEQTGQRGEYLAKWYGRILDHYRNSRTRIIFLRLPRGPVVRPPFITPKTATAREMARANSHVILLPELAFESLEVPEKFGDAMHLNEHGAVEFTAMAARLIANALAH